MRKLRVLALLMFALIMAGCACRTGKIGQDNIPLAGDRSPLEDIHFAFDKYDLDETARAILNNHAAWLGENANRHVQIEGHCDERGTNEYNMVLGANRARAAMEYLRSMGVSADRMSTVSYGEELPLDPRHNEEAWAKNRRAHFNVR